MAMIGIIAIQPLKASAMSSARLFLSGRSQAVRPPKECRFSGTEVAARHFGKGVLLLPIAVALIHRNQFPTSAWSSFFR